MNKINKYLALCGVAIFVCGALFIKSRHKQIDVQIRPDFGTITQKKVYPNSDLTIVYIKQKHELPYSEEVAANIEKDNPLYEAITKDCDSMRRLAATTKDKSKRELLLSGFLSCSRLKQQRADLLATARFNPVDVQKNIYGILNSLKSQGMNIVGVEGADSEKDEAYQAEKGGSMDIKAACRKRYSEDRAFRICQALVITSFLKKGESAGIVFEANHTDEILTVGLEKSEFHTPLLKSVRNNFTSKEQSITQEEYDVLWQKREEYVAKVMVEKMRRSGKTFGAIVFGGGHDKTIPKYFDDLKVSYVVVEPLAYTKQKAADDTN